MGIFEDPFNKRVRLDEYDGAPAEILNSLNQSLPLWTEKVIAKVLPKDVPFFISSGFVCEGFIAGYFSGADMFFLVRYLTPDRARSTDWEKGEKILRDILSLPVVKPEETEIEIKLATSADAPQLAALFTEVFPLYPIPLSEPGHIVNSMDKGTVFVFISKGDEILSAASAEINKKFGNAELTDCATLDKARGNGYMQQLIRRLEILLSEMDIRCMYTISRSQSFGINKVFYNQGYSFGGRLFNNCYISSGLEDMNIWYKVRQANQKS
ncbi:MAG: putative beta-lysine N-acetyltransferase [Robiginitalea sp.]|uniref:putative beta-lysine N-acetyltransferase n=1 Tax=Robiginitalea sp. TaxID=1902411 RepID=UPI003C726EB0